MFSAIPNDHQEIRSTIASLRALLIEDGLPIGHWFASIRWSLTRQVLRHFAVQGLSPDDAPSDLEQNFRRHLGEWTPAMIDAEWPRYCRDLRGLLDAIDADLDADDAIFTDLPRVAGARA